MVKIGIELNHVLRNINKQLLKYYAKAYEPTMEIDTMDDKKDVLSEYIHFSDSHMQDEFMYIEYPYEIFGCAKLMDSNLGVELNTWMHELSNIEDEEFVLGLYSMDEAGLSIQSTFFFLSRIGCRVRSMVFPKNEKEVWDNFDVVITANKRFLENGKPEGKKVVLIEREFNEEVKDKADFVYQDASAVFADLSLLDKLKTNKENT